MVGLGNNVDPKTIRHDDWADKVKNVGKRPEELNSNEGNESSGTGLMAKFRARINSKENPKERTQSMSEMRGRSGSWIDKASNVIKTRLGSEDQGNTSDKKVVRGVGNKNYKKETPEWVKKAQLVGKPRSQTSGAVLLSDTSSATASLGEQGSDSAYEAPMIKIDTYGAPNQPPKVMADASDTSVLTYEEKLVNYVIGGPGTKTMPPTEKLDKFCKKCSTLDFNVLFLYIFRLLVKFY